MADHNKIMTDEELYFFDTFGYLKIEQAIDEETVKEAFEASERVVKDHPELYQDAHYGDKYSGAFVFDKTLERLPRSPKILGYACALLNNLPRLRGGQLMLNCAHHTDHGFHCQKEIDRYRPEDAPGFFANYGTKSIYCDLFTAFLYLTDVRPGDGGLVVIPGSHKSEFYYPKENPYPLDMHGAVTVTVNAGDVIIMPLRLVHGAHKWRPTDRDRRMMFYTFGPQDVYSQGPEMDLQRARDANSELDPETIDLMSMTEKGLKGDLKEVVQKHLELHG